VEIQVHGALIELLGLGILIMGPSGIGKSECVLELVQRGHRLVADDVVRLRSLEIDGGSDRLEGTSPEHIRHYLEIRGIGLLCISDLYGEKAVLEKCNIDLLCHLEKWRQGARYERVGLERPMEILAGVEVPMLVIPVRPATSTATLVEVAGRDTLQRLAGVNAAKRLDDRLSAVARGR
jgi:HPr kinase/phosphorylase